VNTKKGFYTIKLGGVSRTLHFSMNFWVELTEHLDISLQELGEAFGDKMALSGIRGIIYCGMLAYDKENGNEIKYNVYDVGNWLEDLNQEDVGNIMRVMTETKVLGNQLNAGVERTQKKTQIQKN
tara:strand:+ start:632 stop:1006 length:375 start_codon:yes stop_codon:yes gene_type:complete